MQQLLLAGLFGFWLASFGLVSPTSAVAAQGAVRAGSISAGAKPIQADTLPETNTYNPTLMARRQPQPMMAESGLPEEIAPTGPTGGLRLDKAGSGSLLDEIEPPKPIVSSTRMIENPIMDEGALAEMPAEPWSSGSWFFSGHRYAELDFVLFERGRPKGGKRTNLASDQANPFNTLRAFSNTFGVESGVRATLGQNLYRDHLNRDHSVEFTFFGISQFEINDGINAIADNSIFIANVAGFNASDTVTTDHSSSFISYEMNYRIRTRLERDRMVMGPDGSWVRQYTHGHTFSFLAGLRHLSFDEDLQVFSRQTGVAAGTYSGENRITTENDLLGVQFGGEMRSQYETWSWGLLGKAGAYVNFSEVNRQILSANTVIYNVTPALQDAAFLGELRLFAAYNLSPNWTLRSSLDMIAVGGVAQAPYNIDYSFTTTPEVQNAGLVKLMGISFGMEVVW
jgi:hypothetical protein